jgi:hypothetical protein
MDGLQEVITFIDQNQVEEYADQQDFADSDSSEEKVLEQSGVSKDFTNLDFDDLNA